MTFINIKSGLPCLTVYTIFLQRYPFRSPNGSQVARMSLSQVLGPSRYTNAIDLFESLASATWDWLADAKRLGLGFSEILSLT